MPTVSVASSLALDNAKSVATGSVTWRYVFDRRNFEDVSSMMKAHGITRKIQRGGRISNPETWAALDAPVVQERWLDW